MFVVHLIANTFGIKPRLWWHFQAFNTYKNSAAMTTDKLPAFDTCTELVDLDITEEMVSKTARQLKGATGAGGTDSETSASWLLKFATHSQRLREAIARLANGCQMTILLGLPTVL